MASSGKAWKCVVCGYVHRGDSPPDECPVCGASADEFEVHEDSAGRASAAKTKQWRCLICSYIHDGDAPPDECPVCGAGSDEFEACEEKPAQSADSDDKRRVVIVGGGIAAVSAAESVRQTLPQATIVLLAAEKRLPYYRLNLTRRLAGELEDDDLPLHPESWYDEHNIDLRVGVRVAALDPDGRTVETEDGQSVPFDKLILACGAHPFIPPIEGANLEGVSAIRTLKDVHALLERLKDGGGCVCIGGGILGLETAGALAKQGVETALLEGFGYLLPRQLNQDAARVLEKHVRKMGIAIHNNASAETIESGENGLEVVLKDDTRLSGAAVTITTGIRANTHLARRAGLHVDQGIVVNECMSTSHPDIFAAGDCAEYAGSVAGLWEPAQYQGAIAGLNAAGTSTEFGGIPRMNTLKVLGIKLFSIGVIQPDDGSYTEVADEDGGVYRRFLFHDGRLVGAILVGDTKLAAAATKAVRDRVDCSSLIAARPTVDDAATFLEGIG